MTTFRIATYNVENLFDRFDDPYSASDDIYGRFTSRPKSRSDLYDLGMRIRSNGVPRAGSQSTWPVDLVALQELENFGALLDFVQGSVGPEYGARTGVVSQPSNDPRGIDLGMIIRTDLFRIGRVTSHRFRKFNRADFESYQFGRDCLQIEILLEETRELFLTAFVCHFKSKYTRVDAIGDPTGYAEEQRINDQKRNAEAREVVRIIRNALNVDQDRFVVLGDLNDTPDSPALAPLIIGGDVDDAGDGLKLHNAVELIPQTDTAATSAVRRPRDTHHWKRPVATDGGSRTSVDEWSQIDFILCSDKLWELRTGTAGVDNSKKKQGSDHYLSFAEFKIPD